MDAYQQMLKTIEERAIFAPEDALLLMVSGGSDSTALARMIARMRDEGLVGVVTMLHMNHKLRGQDSEDDAAFVAALAEELSIPLFLCEMDIASEAARTGENIEAVARHERYMAAREALASMCEHEGVPLSKSHIVTAHTADDRIENFYMRSIVGTGPGGFRSMKYKNSDVVRPLLDCTRESLRKYLRETNNFHDEGMAFWREDATNEDTDRFRAYVRHEIVPRARKWNPKLDSTLIRTMNLIADEDEMIDAMAHEIASKDVEALSGYPQDGYLLLPSFGRHPIPLQRRAVHKLLKSMLGEEERIDTDSVNAVLGCFDTGVPRSGYVTNIQGNLAVSSNKHGVRIEPMAAFRKRRRKIS